uniref:non-specific serine/threonine protein kinase n=1 Tax=Globisporangium ultimum (strain ATCC 200006 / CBS 805.95 / DAOM BR144) TaxID=431595 RepID=K3W6N3_GLOUD
MAKKKGKKKAATEPNAHPQHEPTAPAKPLVPSTLWDAETLQQSLELQAQELEVLQAIYDQDLVLKTSTLVYNYIFTIRLFCEAFDGATGNAAATAEVLLHIDFGRAYPLKQAAAIAVELKHGLSKDETKQLTKELEKLAEEKIGDVMAYDLVMHATEFIQEHLKDQSSFFDQMMQRQQDRENEKKRAEEKLHQLEEEETLAKTQEILAIIDAERKRKQEKMKKRNNARRRRRHRSSIDMADEYGDSQDELDGSDGDLESSSDRVSTIPERQRSMDDQFEEEDDEGSSSNSDSLSEHDPMDSEHLRSRYHGDFKELGLLGRGGGGEVVKVRNRLDRQLYAVKKVKLDPEDPTMKKKILREVKTISRMQHRHIVRYFQAWIEGDSGGLSDDDDDDESSDDDFEDSEEDDSVSLYDESGAQERSSESSDMMHEEGLDLATNTTDEDDDWLGTMNRSVGLWPSKHDSRRSSNPFRKILVNSVHDDGFDWEGLEEAPIVEEGDDSSDDDDGQYRRKRQPHAPAKSPKRKSEKLYIQMEFCEGKALREVIDKGSLWTETDKIWTLFRQILEAIVYIHRQGIIHRDIKPPNIFLDAEGTVKLGDFGLAVRPPKILDDDIDENAVGTEESTRVLDTSTGTFLSTGSSAAELYGRLKLENLESTRVTPLPRAAHEEFTSFMSASEMENSNITTGVGTAFYRAPEQEKEGQRYNQKADMFSLGILFFEMWSPPFTTGMERAQALIGLREKHALPPEFRAPDAVKEIVLWLCNPNPAARPNAAELLASPLLPAKMEVEGTYLKEALEILANPEGKFFCQLIDALLTQEPVNHIDYTYDHLESVKMRSYMIELRAKSYVKNVLQKVFERHGAVEHTTPLLMPRAPEQNYTGIPLTTPQNSCGLLDGAGVSVSLPFDLTERLARFVARHNITRLKCYQFDRVYRKNIVGGHPRELMESDFDIIWDDRGPSRFMELEGLEVVAEVIDNLGSSLGSYYLRFNDARITRAILELCNVPQSARREILKLLANEASSRVHAGVASTIPLSMKPGRAKFIARKIKEHGASQESIDALKPFFLLPEDSATSLEMIEHEIQRLFAKNLSINKAKDEKIIATERKHSQRRDTQLRRMLKDCNEGIAALRHLLDGIEFLRLSRHVCTRLDLGLSPRPERYVSGFIFQAVLMATSTVHPAAASTMKATTTSTQVIAEGGRYDTLITRFKLPAAYVKSSSVAAMGVRFSIDKIVSCVVDSMSLTVAEPKALCHDLLGGARKILVCTAGKATDTVLLRMQISLMLWNHGIGADYLHPDPLHLEDLEDYCAQQGIHWMVIVQKHMMREKKQVKIRTVKNPSEPDVVVSSSSLVDTVMELLASGKSSHHSESTSGGGRNTHTYDHGLNGSHGPGGSHQRGGRESVAGGAGFQPVFDVKVVDGKHYVGKDGNSKNKNNSMDNQKITRRVSKWITSSFSSRGDEAMKVLSVDLPFALVRELSSALMEHGGTDGLDIVCANYPRYRKQLRYTTDEILALEPKGGRERYVLLHSLVDDRYDLMSLAQSSKSGRKQHNNTAMKRSP